MEEQLDALAPPQSPQSLTPDGALAEPLRAPLEALRDGLRDALGASLRSMIVYGSAARGDHDAQRSDVNVMLIVDEVSADLLRRVSAPLTRARRALPVALTTLTPDDLTSSCDVFPLRFLDLQRTHLVLYGEDVLQTIDIAWSHLRLRVEQQIKELMFSLRDHYLAHHERPEQLERALVRGYGQFLIAIGALLYLKDPQWWVSGKAQIAARASAELGFDGPLMRSLMALHRRELEPTAAQLHVLYDHFMALVDEAARLVDQLDPA